MRGEVSALRSKFTLFRNMGKGRRNIGSNNPVFDLCEFKKLGNDTHIEIWCLIGKRKNNKQISKIGIIEYLEILTITTHGGNIEKALKNELTTYIWKGRNNAANNLQLLNIRIKGYNDCQIVRKINIATMTKCDHANCNTLWGNEGKLIKRETRRCHLSHDENDIAI